MTPSAKPTAFDHRRRLVWLVALAAGIGLLMVLPLLAASELDNAINLSKRASLGLKSAHPELATSRNGQYVAVVWSRGYDAEANTKEFGHIVLKSADKAVGWEKQVNVYTATSSVWGVQPSLTFLSTHDSLVAVTWVECRQQTTRCNKVMLAFCDVSAYPDACQLPQLVYEDQQASFSTPRIACDGGGRLHLIWKKNSGGLPSTWGIWYSRLDSAVAGKIGQTSANSYNPVLAWSDAGTNPAGRLHMAWYEYADDVAARRIRYLADDSPDDDVWTAVDDTQWKAPPGYFLSGEVNEMANQPSLATGGNYVYLAWAAGNSTHQYVLAYDGASYANDAWAWQDPSSGNSAGPDCGSFGDGCGIPDKLIFANNRAFSSPGDLADLFELRPSIAISGSTPLVVWHFRDSPEGENLKYMIGYYSSITASGQISWVTQLTITQGLDYDHDGLPEDSTNPKLGIWPDHQVHIVHMGMWGGEPESSSDWDIYYRGGVITDTSSLPTPVPTQQTTGTPTPLPTPTYTPTPVLPGQPTPTSTPYPYDDPWRDYMPTILRL